LLAVGTLLGWALSHEPASAEAGWQRTGLALAVALVFYLFAELRRGVARTPAWLVVLSMLAVATLGAPFALESGLGPWLALFAGLGALGVRLGSLERPHLQLASAALGAVGVGALFAAGVGAPEMPSGGLFLGLIVGLAAA